MEFYPLNRENILRLIGDPAQGDSDVELAMCPICCTIPEVSRLLDIPARDISYGGYPDAFAQLEGLIEISSSLTLMRCPNCGRLYTDEEHYEYLAGGSEDEYILTRVSRGQALEMLESLGGRGLEQQRGKWVVTW